jgi:hypothetical protein
VDTTIRVADSAGENTGSSRIDTRRGESFASDQVRGWPYLVNVVHLLEERTFDPPRGVDIEHNGRWWTGTQTAWRLCDDDRGWMADCSWTEQCDWGPGKYLTMLPPQRVRVTD